MTPRWYCLTVRPGYTDIAAGNLERQSFEIYNPKMTVELLRHGKIVRDKVPLFPGYLLIRFVLAVASWRAINNTRGVVRLLSCNEDGAPSPLPIGEIEALREREKCGKLYISRVRRFHRGDKVRFKFGATMGLTGVVQYSRAERVVLLLNLLGRKVRVKAPTHTLDLVDNRSVMACL